MQTHQKTKNEGFLLISLLIAVAIIAILYVISMRGSPKPNSGSGQATSTPAANSDAATLQMGRQGINQAQQGKDELLQQQSNIQNELNAK